jgi:hypothetical protein
MAALNLMDKDSTRKKQKRRRGFFRKEWLSPKELRGKGHPAAVDARYRRVFPWRDQRNQLHVHSELADPQDRTKVDPGLRLLAVRIDKDNEGQIRKDIAAGLFSMKPVHARKLSAKERGIVDERYQLLLANLHASLEKAMRGEEPVPPEQVYVRALEAGDLAPGESDLNGQYGLFNRRDAQGKWRTVSEGMHLCFFSGCFCRDAKEYEVECARYSKKEVAAYALAAGVDEANYPCISPYGGGDLGQFANSALARDGNGRLVEDGARINTRFAYAEAIFEDLRPGGHGRHLAYPVVFLYMLAAPQADDVSEREARVSYGQPYWDSVDAQSR